MNALKINKNNKKHSKFKRIKLLILIMITSLLLFPNIVSVTAEELEIEWIKIKNFGSNDKSTSVGFDSLGNVIITGYSYVSGNFNYNTVKYDSAGNLLWTRTYNGGWTDQAYDVAVDSDDNIIVTGTTYSNGVSYDYYTIKYDPYGNELWNVTFDGDRSDIAYSVAVDSQDNIIVAGSYGNVGQEDYCTIKYDPNGVEIGRWIYAGVGDDVAQGVAVDSADCVIVTGKSKVASKWNWYTIKYDFDGTIIWDAVHNSGGNDIACDVTVDSEDSVIVTGSSDSSAYDFYTIKYDSNGDYLWNANYPGIGQNEAYAVASNFNDEVVVTGRINQNGLWRFLTVKYSHNGVIIWSDVHSSNYDCCGYGVDVDSSGNIVITGYSKTGYNDYYTVKYGWPDNNIPPNADFTFNPASPTRDDIVQFTDLSTDADGFIVNWTWDLDDGTILYDTNISHQYTTVGVYNVRLTVTDDNGSISYKEKNVNVVNVEPVADFSFEPLSPKINNTVFFNSSSTDMDGFIVNWTWDLDDGTFLYGEYVTHKYLSEGAYSVNLTVEDNDGGTTKVSKTVVVASVPTVTKDVDQDGVDELAKDTDENPDNGYEFFIDPNSNSNAVYSLDGEGDNKIDHFVNITLDIRPDKYWDPDDDILANISYIDVDLDGTDELVYDSDDDSVVDRYYDPDDYLIKIYDILPPSQVTGLTVTDAKDGKLSISWNSADDNIGVDYYKIYRDGAFLTNVYSTSYVDTGLTNDVSYAYNVSAVDTSGNTGVSSDTVSGTPTETYIPPNPVTPPGPVTPVEPEGKKPAKPSKPEGPTTGFVNVEYTYTSSTTTEEGSLEYYFDWDDGTNSNWVGPLSSGVKVSAKKTWTSAGVYNIRVKAKNSANLQSDWSSTLQITIYDEGKNFPPEKPSRPIGASIGDIYAKYIFSTNTSDPNGDEVKYEFDWGDNTTSFTEFSPSDKRVTLSHYWTLEGIYSVKVRAFDEDNASSEWSVSTMFVVDKLRPVVSVFNPSMNEIVGGKINISVNITFDDMSYVVFELMQANITYATFNDTEAPFNWLLDTTQYDEGMYTLRVTVYDSMGNANVASSSFSIKQSQKETGSIPLFAVVAVIAAVIAVGIVFFFKKYKISFYFEE